MSNKPHTFEIQLWHRNHIPLPPLFSSKVILCLERKNNIHGLPSAGDFIVWSCWSFILRAGGKRSKQLCWRLSWHQAADTDLIKSSLAGLCQMEAAAGSRRSALLVTDPTPQAPARQLTHLWAPSHDLREREWGKSGDCWWLWMTLIFLLWWVNFITYNSGNTRDYWMCWCCVTRNIIPFPFPLAYEALHGLVDWKPKRKSHQHMWCYSCNYRQLNTQIESSTVAIILYAAAALCRDQFIASVWNCGGRKITPASLTDGPLNLFLLSAKSAWRDAPWVCTQTCLMLQDSIGKSVKRVVEHFWEICCIVGRINKYF